MILTWTRAIQGRLLRFNLWLRVSEMVNSHAFSWRRDMRGFARAWMVLALLAAIGEGRAVRPARAQGAVSAERELTVERIYSAPSLSGHLTEGIEWTPDSKRISYLVRKGSGADAATEFWTMDASTGERKLLLSAELMKAAMQPEKQQNIQATGLGRVAVESYIWSPDVKAILFAGGSSLALLELATMKPKT